MKTIFKYHIPVDIGNVKIEIPTDSTIIHVSGQGRNDEVCLWIEATHFDPPSKERTFQVFGTGHDIPDGYSYVGTTVVTPFLVWHVYEWIK